MNCLEHDPAIGRCLYSAQEIGLAVERLASQIAADHAGQPLLLLGVLKGALCFVADLSRALAAKPCGPSEIIVDHICIERYGASGRRGAGVHVKLDASLPVGGANVLIAEDIADEGLTLHFLRELVGRRGPARLSTAVLFDKPLRRSVELPIEYIGLQVPDVFAIGYGLDYQEQYRNLPFLAELRESQTV